jgi:hypothetical protein
MRIFLSKKEEVTEGWKKLPNEEYYVGYSSPNAIRVTKSWRMKWMGCVEMHWRYEKFIQTFTWKTRREYRCTKS